MSGKRLGSFREGDRSEYLAMFGLSRFAFVHPVPRQEDFGVVDFLCILAKSEGRNVYPESAFYVQVKSIKEPVVLDADAVRWITHHMDHPLLLCFSDKTTGELAFYSCSRIWLPLFLRAEPDEVTLLLDSDGPAEHYDLDEGPGKRTTFRVYLGPPIFMSTVTELEQTPDVAYSVVSPWIRADAANIARRHLGRIAVACFAHWQTNAPPSDTLFVSYYYGPNFSIAERDLAPMLTALAHNYRHHRLGEEARSLATVLEGSGAILGCARARIFRGNPAR
jgi:hypothetical protein